MLQEGHALVLVGNPLGSAGCCTVPAHCSGEPMFTLEKSQLAFPSQFSALFIHLADDIGRELRSNPEPAAKQLNNSLAHERWRWTSDLIGHLGARCHRLNTWNKHSWNRNVLHSVENNIRLAAELLWTWSWTEQLQKRLECTRMQLTINKEVDTLKTHTDWENPCQQWELNHLPSRLLPPTLFLSMKCCFWYLRSLGLVESLNLELIWVRLDFQNL